MSSTSQQCPQVSTQPSPGWLSSYLDVHSTRAVQVMFSPSTHTLTHTYRHTLTHTQRRSHNLHDESKKLLPNRLGLCRSTNCHQIIDICRRCSSSLVPFALCSTPSLPFLASSRALDYISRTVKAPPSRRHNRVPGMHCSVHCLAMKLLNCCRAHCKHTHTQRERLHTHPHKLL